MYVYEKNPASNCVSFISIFVTSEGPLCARGFPPSESYNVDSGVTLDENLFSVVREKPFAHERMDSLGNFEFAEFSIAEYNEVSSPIRDPLPKTDVKSFPSHDTLPSLRTALLVFQY